MGLHYHAEWLVGNVRFTLRTGVYSEIWY